MNKQDIQKTADDVFKQNPEAPEVHITSDGYAFINENALKLHKNTNKSGKKLEHVTIKNNKLFEASKGKSDNPKKLSKMNKTELEAVAKDLVDISKANNNKERVQLIEEAQKAAAIKKTETKDSVNKTASSEDISADDSQTKDSVNKTASSEDISADDSQTKTS